MNSKHDKLKESHTRHITTQLLKDKKEILKATRNNHVQGVGWGPSTIRLTADFFHQKPWQPEGHRVT